MRLRIDNWNKGQDSSGANSLFCVVGNDSRRCVCMAVQEDTRFLTWAIKISIDESVDAEVFEWSRMAEVSVHFQI